MRTTPWSMIGRTARPSPTRKRWPSFAVNAGTQFDPEVVEVFCDVYDSVVPPDGLEEVYRLHERARGGLSHIPVSHDHPHPGEVDDPAPRTTRTRRRPGRAREASG